MPVISDGSTPSRRWCCGSNQFQQFEPLARGDCAG
jgi:hypothetical protein